MDDTLSDRIVIRANFPPDIFARDISHPPVLEASSIT
jgi:hypothetical protein